MLHVKMCYQDTLIKRGLNLVRENEVTKPFMFIMIAEMLVSIVLAVRGGLSIIDEHGVILFISSIGYVIAPGVVLAIAFSKEGEDLHIVSVFRRSFIYMIILTCIIAVVSGAIFYPIVYTIKTLLIPMTTLLLSFLMLPLIFGAIKGWDICYTWWSSWSGSIKESLDKKKLSKRYTLSTKKTSDDNETLELMIAGFEDDVREINDNVQ